MQQLILHNSEKHHLAGKVNQIPVIIQIFPAPLF